MMIEAVARAISGVAEVTSAIFRRVWGTQTKEQSDSSKRAEVLRAKITESMGRGDLAAANVARTELARLYDQAYAESK